ARYSSARVRSFSMSSTTACVEPSNASGGSGTTTWSSATSMSSGPAISRMKGTIASAIIEPSRGTSARLYMGRLRSLSRPTRDIQWGVVGTNDQDPCRRPAQHRLGHASQDQAPETATAVRGHHDEIGLLDRRRFDDGRGGRAIPHVRLDTPDPFVLESL